MKHPAFAAALLVAALLTYSSLFVVSEREQAFLTQFGRPVGEAITRPGLKFRLPFVQKVHRFEKRFLEWDGEPNQVQTKDKRYIAIDAYARWRIVDPLVFYEKVKDELGAQARLDDILDGESRKVIARHELVEMVRSVARPEMDGDGLNEDELLDRGVLAPFEVGRNEIAGRILETSKPQLSELGVELLDFRFKRINYGLDVQRKQFDRMISERNRIASKFRSEGEGEASKIQGDRERQLKGLESEAFRQAEEIRGAADAEAVSIYAEAHNQNREAREFYRFLKTMEAYAASLTERDILVLSTDSDFFRFLGGSGLEEDAGSIPE